MKLVSRCGPLAMVAFGVLVVCSGLLVLVFSWLRETPVFWRNEGGYPVWLREMVLEWFYPFLMINTSGLVFLSAIFFMTLGRRGILRRFQMALILAGWVLLGSSMVVAWKNNAVNILKGRPVHSHETGW